MNKSLRLQQIAARGHHVLTSGGQKRWGTPLNIQLGVENVTLSLCWQDDKLYFLVTDAIDPIEKAYLEAFGELASKLNWAKLQVLGTREIESFLRDNNATPAHGENPAGQPGLWLEKVREHLLAPWLLARLEAPSKAIHASSSAIDLVGWLARLDEAFWGHRISPSIGQSQAVGVVPLAQGHEVRWYFPANADAGSARELCLALEQTLQARGLTVKVVA